MSYRLISLLSKIAQDYSVVDKTPYEAPSHIDNCIDVCLKVVAYKSVERGYDKNYHVFSIYIHRYDQIDF